MEIIKLFLVINVCGVVALVLFKIFEWTGIIP